MRVFPHFLCMNKLVVLSGVPGSGKSYFSRTLKKIKGSHVYVVSSDEIRAQICGIQSDLSKDNIMWPMYYKLADVYSSDPDGMVILDSTNATTYYRTVPTKELKNKFDEVYLIVFKLDRAIVLNQNLQREFPIPTDALEGLIDRFEMPNEEDEKFFDKIWIVESNDIVPVINILTTK